MLSKLAGASEHTIWFLFFLFIFIVGALMASRFIGSYIKPTSNSLGSALQAA